MSGIYKSLTDSISNIKHHLNLLYKTAFRPVEKFTSCKNYYEVEYTFKGEKYKLLLPNHTGPILSDIKNIHGIKYKKQCEGDEVNETYSESMKEEPEIRKDVTSEILPYLGPFNNVHNSTHITPRLLGFSVLVFSTTDDESIIFIDDEPIILY